LRKHGVSLAVGSDSYSQTAQAEAFVLEKLGVFDTRALLKMWCETTAAAIFPERKVGALREGFEASFLVLSGNPLEDFSHVTRIEARIKQGILLPQPA
jgi:imidazolonepropionase-like amidohydrolase